MKIQLNNIKDPSEIERLCNRLSANYQIPKENLQQAIQDIFKAHQNSHHKPTHLSISLKREQQLHQALEKRNIAQVVILSEVTDPTDPIRPVCFLNLLHNDEFQDFFQTHTQIQKLFNDKANPEN